MRFEREPSMYFLKSAAGFRIAKLSAGNASALACNAGSSAVTAWY